MRFKRTLPSTLAHNVITIFIIEWSIIKLFPSFLQMFDFQTNHLQDTWRYNPCKKSKTLFRKSTCVFLHRKARFIQAKIVERLIVEKRFKPNVIAKWVIGRTLYEQQTLTPEKKNSPVTKLSLLILLIIRVTSFAR